MSITQTVEIPVNRRLTIDVPNDVPTGPVILTFSPARTVESNNPISNYFNILSPNTYGDGLTYQKNIRDEWDD